MDITQKNLLRPITTGTVQTNINKINKINNTDADFKSILEYKLQEKDELVFSKHAKLRTEQRGVVLSGSDIMRLKQAISKAENKGLRDTLIIMDKDAYIVNVPNKTIITVIEENKKNSTVFTNIDGAVII